MLYLMFTAGIFVGFVAGVCLWEFLVAGPEFRKARMRENRLLDRASMWQRVWNLEYAERLGTRAPDTFSRRVTGIKLVK